MAIYKGDVGTKLEFDIGVNVDEVDTALLIIKYPSGNKITKDLSIDTENNVLYYITDTDDLNESGLYHLQSRVTLKGGWNGASELVKINVLDTL